MYVIDEKFFNELLKNYSRSIVGRICKQNELIQDSLKESDQIDSSLFEEKLNLLKSFNRELIYESIRDLQNQVKAYSRGKAYEKFKIYKPTK